ncbi:MAG: 50S ribosomal protein L11 methyltransferase [Bacteroidales bacterium]|nr:50S ribosomal protein L11 methyltransferase [Bacteroidales bacterium]
MNYIEVKLVPEPMSEDVADVIAALIAPLGFDSFTTEQDCLKAYCPQNRFDDKALQEVLDNIPLPDVTAKWVAEVVEMENWNQAWEEENTLTPIAFRDQQIVIHPHMSFGSGHHETTSQMLDAISRYFERRGAASTSVLDMGTGTGVLAIACALCGAQVRAIEIEDWVADNARDNVLANDMAGHVVVDCGDASLLADGRKYDLVLANINRNVLLADMPAYVADMKAKATLLMSGFYEEDVPAIRERAEQLGLRYVEHQSQNNWVVIRFER